MKELQQETMELRQNKDGRSSVTSMLGQSVSASPTPSLMSDNAWMPGDDVSLTIISIILCHNFLYSGVLWQHSCVRVAV